MANPERDCPPIRPPRRNRPTVSTPAGIPCKSPPRMQLDYLEAAECPARKMTRAYGFSKLPSALPPEKPPRKIISGPCRGMTRAYGFSKLPSALPPEKPPRKTISGQEVCHVPSEISTRPCPGMTRAYGFSKLPSALPPEKPPRKTISGQVGPEPCRGMTRAYGFSKLPSALPPEKPPRKPSGQLSTDRIKNDVVIARTIRRIVNDFLHEWDNLLDHLEILRRITVDPDFEDNEFILQYQSHQHQVLAHIYKLLSKLSTMHSLCTEGQYKKFHDLHHMGHTLRVFIQALQDLLIRDNDMLTMIYTELECLNQERERLGDETNEILESIEHMVCEDADFYDKEIKKLQEIIVIGEEPVVCLFLVNEGEKLLKQLEQKTGRLMDAFGQLFAIKEDVGLD